MNIHIDPSKTQKRDARVGLAIADGDIHPDLPQRQGARSLPRPALAGPPRQLRHDPAPRLSGRPRLPQGHPGRLAPRRLPAEGGYPGSNLDFMRDQHLDPNNVELGILNPIAPTPGNAQNLELGTALATRHQRMAARRVAGATSRGSRARSSSPTKMPRHRRAKSRLARRSALRPGPADEPHRRTARPAPLLADLRSLRAATTCRSAFTPSATAAIRSPAAAGRRSTSRK